MFRLHAVPVALVAFVFSFGYAAPARAQFFLESATTIQPGHGYLDVSYVRAPAMGGPAAHRFGNALLRLPVTGRLEGRLGFGSLVLKSGDVSAEGTGLGIKTWLVRPGEKILCGLYRAEFSHDRSGKPVEQKETIHNRGRKLNGPPPHGRG